MCPHFYGTPSDMKDVYIKYLAVYKIEWLCSTCTFEMRVYLPLSCHSAICELSPPQTFLLCSRVSQVKCARFAHQPGTLHRLAHQNLTGRPNHGVLACAFLMLNVFMWETRPLLPKESPELKSQSNMSFHGYHKPKKFSGPPQLCTWHWPGID